MDQLNLSPAHISRLDDVPAVDKEIAQLHRATAEHMRNLASRRNSLVPINRLAPELLAEIFLATREDQEENKWLPITQVCSLWRSVCLDLPALWREVSDADSIEWMTLTVHRARTAPLVIYLDAKDESANGRTRYAMSVFSRCRTFEVSTQEERSRIHFPQFSVPAPCLERLRISYGDYLSKGRMPRLPDRLFECYTPSLKNLNIYRCVFDLGSPFFSSLSNMHRIKLACEGSEVRPTSADFEQLLRRSLSLDRLRLFDCLPLSLTSNIPLTSLTGIHVRDSNVAACVQAIRCIPFPRARKVEFSLSDLGFEDDETQRLLVITSHLAEHVKHNSNEDSLLGAQFTYSTHSFVVQCDIFKSEADLTYVEFGIPPRSLHVSCFVHSDYQIQMPSTLWNRTSAGLDTWFQPELSRRLLKLIIGALYEASWDPPPHADFFEPLLATMTRVRYLTLVGNMGRVFLHMLSESSASLALPALQHLVVEWLELDAHLRALLEFLLRQRRGRIASLQLMKCDGVTRGFVARLSANCPLVIWDEKEMGF